MRVEIGITFSARSLVDFVGRRVQSSDSEGPSNAVEERKDEAGTAGMRLTGSLTSSQSGRDTKGLGGKLGDKQGIKMRKSRA